MRDRSPTRPPLQVSTVGLFASERLAELRESYSNTDNLLMCVFDVLIMNNEVLLKYLSAEDFMRLFLVNTHTYARLLDRIDLAKELIGVDNIYYAPMRASIRHEKMLRTEFNIAISLSVLEAFVFAYGVVDKDIADYQFIDCLKLAFYVFIFSILICGLLDIISGLHLSGGSDRIPSPLLENNEESSNTFNQLRKTVFSGALFKRPSEKALFIQQLKKIRPDVFSDSGEIILKR